MARKKSRKTKNTKIVAKIDTRFDCPVCNHEKVVQCRKDAKLNKGTAFCNVCQANYGCKTTEIDNAIDIYYSWIDNIDSKY